jgi:hypothetical protein
MSVSTKICMSQSTQGRSFHREGKDPSRGRARIPGYSQKGFHISTSSAQPQPLSPSAPKGSGRLNCNLTSVLVLLGGDKGKEEITALENQKRDQARVYYVSIKMINPRSAWKPCPPARSCARLAASQSLVIVVPTLTTRVSKGMCH